MNLIFMEIKNGERGSDFLFLSLISYKIPGSPKVRV